MSLTIGVPRMMKEPGEKRVFLPEFIHLLAHLGATLYVEEAYGARSGYSFEDFQQAHKAVRRCDRAAAFQQDLVLVLRSPTLDEFRLLKPGGCLMSMLHFPTRPKRVQLLQELGLRAISLDSIVNDNNLRLVENMQAVAWNGLEAAFDVLEQRWPDLRRRKPAVARAGPGHGHGGQTRRGGRHQTGQRRAQRAAHRARRPGRGGLRPGATSASRRSRWSATSARPISWWTPPSAATPRCRWCLTLGSRWLPEHAVIADLSVDPYLLDVSPPVVRGVEGIPQGSLDKYIFAARRPRLGQNRARLDPLAQPPGGGLLLLVAGHPPGGLHGALRPPAGAPDGSAAGAGPTMR